MKTLAEKIQELVEEAETIKLLYPRIKEIEYKIEDAEYHELSGIKEIANPPSFCKHNDKFFAIYYNGVAQIVIWTYPYKVNKEPEFDRL